MNARRATRPIITFLSDYGLQDEFVGTCHGVIARRCPHARVIDLTHGIPPQDVRAGALALAAALPFVPAGVHLAVVDPGVGATAAERARRAIALRTAAEERLLVGPDNGLLMLAADRFGGAAQGVDISHSPERAPVLSRTFHGRDLFAPVAAALAAGEPLAGVGAELDVAQLRRLALPQACIRDGALRAHVLHSDRFGNLILDATPQQLAQLGAREGGSVTVEHRGHIRAAQRAGTFADVGAGELLIYEDAQRMVALAVNGGSAERQLGAARDEELRGAPGVSGAYEQGALGRPRLHLRRTDSTNDRARALAAAGAPHGTLVTAGEQSAGRGRQGRSWSAPAGSSLLMSLVLRWAPCEAPPQLLSLAAAVAVCDVAGQAAEIKWPNDIVVDDHPGLAKLAGLLIEGRPQEGWAVLGIGLNVAVELAQLPAEVRAGAATLGRPRTEIEPTLERLLAALETRLAAPESDTLAAWRARDALRGREVGWATGRGRAQGVDGTGRLVVALAGGGQATLQAGEVHLLPVR